MARMTGDTITLYASRAGDAWTCPESIMGDAPAYDTVNVAGDLGSAFHHWAQFIESPRDAQPNTENLAAQYGVDPDELSKRIAYAVIAWRTLGPLYTVDPTQAEGGAIELRLHHVGRIIELRSRIDRLKLVDDWCRILDWKTGLYDPKHFHQLMAYAFLVMVEDPSLTRAELHSVYVKLGHTIRFEFTRAEVMDWYAELEKRIGRGGFKTGDHCTWCSRRPTCASAGRFESNALQLADDPALPASINADNIEEIGPQLIADYVRIKYIERRIKGWLAAVRSVIDRVGPIPDGAGGELTVIEKKKREVDPTKAIPLLLTEYEWDDVAPFVQLTVGGVESLAKSKAEPRKGAAEAKRVCGMLEQGGALTRTTSTVLHRRRDQNE